MTDPTQPTENTESAVSDGGVSDSPVSDSPVSDSHVTGADLDLPTPSGPEECRQCRGYMSPDTIVQEHRLIDGVATATIRQVCEHCGTPYLRLYRKWCGIWQLAKSRVVTDEQRHIARAKRPDPTPGASTRAADSTRATVSAA